MIAKREFHPTGADFIHSMINSTLKIGQSRGFDNVSKKRSFALEFPNFALINALLSLAGDESGLDANKVLNICLSHYMEHLQDSLSDKDVAKLADAYKIAYRTLIQENLPGLEEGLSRFDGVSTNA